MKKLIFTIITALLFSAVLYGCTSTNEQQPDVQSEATVETQNETEESNEAQDEPQEDEEETEKLNIIATIFAPYDFAREIAGTKANVTMLIPPGSESHSYQPSPRDIIEIMDADVFLHIGGDMDIWVDRILGSMDTSGMTIIALMDSVDGLEEEIVEGMEVHDDDDHGHDHDDHDHDHDDEIIFDEHVWTSPKNAMLIVRSIADVLIEIDPDNASYYNDNLSEYIKKLEELDAAFRDVVNNSVRRTIAFGDRFPFRYFAYEYGLDYFAAFPGCSTDTEPSAATVAFLINQVKALELPVVFHVELSNERLANTISEATGAKVMMLHASHNISRDDFLNNLSYIELMTNNISALREALH